MRDEEAPSGVRTGVHPYLASKELRAWLQRFYHELPGLKGRTSHGGELVLPAFVYSLAEPMILLLDRFHQAVPFEDMVLGVQSRAGLAQLDATCAGAHALMDTARAERALLGALLQSGWGVAPSDVTWSAARNETEASLLWAVGATPFGPYSARDRLSFALRDAAARAALHARAAEVVAQVQQLAGYYDEFGVEVDAVLGEKEQLLALQRTNVLAHKLDRASAYLSLHNFNLARYYLHSTRHDLAALSKLLSDGAKALGSRLVCR